MENVERIPLFFFPLVFLLNNLTFEVCDIELLFIDIHCQYKNLLQMFARQRNLDLPIYSCECDQEVHASHFKARVKVGDQIFENPEFFDTSKEAESDAAKAALMSVLVECFQEASSAKYLIISF